jgi:hypothetical protein
MVLADPTNIYYATGFWPQTLVMGHLGSSIAVVPADPSLPATLITAQFLHYFFDLDDVPAGSPLQIKLYTAPDQDGENAMPPFFFSSAKDGAGRPLGAGHPRLHPGPARGASRLPDVDGGAAVSAGRERRCGGRRQRCGARSSAAASTHPPSPCCAVSA